MDHDEKLEFMILCQIMRGERDVVNAVPDEVAGQVAARAEAEGVAPLLYWHLREMGWPVGMADVRGRLTRAYYNTVAQNSLLLLELSKLLDLFAQADIPVIVLKGGALADGYYDDIGLRPMNDLDLLIPEAHMSSAVNIIRSQGYQLAEAEIFPGIIQQVSHHTSWQGGPGGRVELELHWNLIAGRTDDRTIPVDWFWGQSEQLPGRSQLFQGRHIPQLNPTAHLLYLAAHLMLRHEGRNERLIWFYDADRLIRSRRVDWVSFVQQAHRLVWGAPVRYMLEGTAARFHTPLPDGLGGQLAADADWHAILAARHQVGPFSRWESTRQALKHLAWPQRLRLMAALVFPSPAYLRWRYRPQWGWTWPLYYLYRWGDVGKEVGGKVLGGLKRG